MRLNEREIHGGTPMAGTSDKPLLVIETDDRVVVQLNSYTELKLHPHAARFLARKINRIALRIEKRAASGIEAPTGDETGTGSAVGESPAPEEGGAQ